MSELGFHSPILTQFPLLGGGVEDMCLMGITITILIILIVITITILTIPIVIIINILITVLLLIIFVAQSVEGSIEDLRLMGTMGRRHKIISVIDSR